MTIELEDVRELPCTCLTKSHSETNHYCPRNLKLSFNDKVKVHNLINIEKQKQLKLVKEKIDHKMNIYQRNLDSVDIEVLFEEMEK